MPEAFITLTAMRVSKVVAAIGEIIRQTGNRPASVRVRLGGS